MPDVFHVSPRMAVKLARCNEIARAQNAKTLRDHNKTSLERPLIPLSTREDGDIGRGFLNRNPRLVSHALSYYLRNLNA